MAPYFDTTVQANKNMLPPAYRVDTELALAAAYAEAMVIGWYTMNPPYFFYTAASVANVSQWIWPSTERGGGEDITAQGQPSTAVVPLLRVYLAGYKVDASDPNVDPNLKAALQFTIADVTAWTIARWRGLQPGVGSASSPNAGSKSFRPYADDSFPPNWNWRLAHFDSRPVNWGL